jgi:hypothetical protein
MSYFMMSGKYLLLITQRIKEFLESMALFLENMHPIMFVHFMLSSFDLLV